MKRGTICGIVFAALTILFMASAMAGNAGNDRSMTQDDCRSCHLADQTSSTIHHTEDLLIPFCFKCHMWDDAIVKVTDCKICHVDEQRDHHRLPGNDCAYCHGASVAARAHGQATTVHQAVTGTCSDCHSVGNQAAAGQGGQEAGS